MNNKGFTLVELMVTLILIALMATIVLVNMNGLQTKEEDQTYQVYKSKIESSACSYIDLENNSYLRDACMNAQDGCNFSLTKLIEEGLIDGDTKDTYTNKTANEEGNAIYVNIKWVDNNGYKEKTCTIEEGEAPDIISLSISYDYTGQEDYFYVPITGYYKIEALGAQGGSLGSYSGGLGGLVSGTAALKSGDKIAINVGGQNGYNGGGASNANFGNGGGATTIKDSSNNFILVAGGGSGAASNQNGQAGGGDPKTTTILAGQAGGGGGGYYGGATGSYFSHKHDDSCVSGEYYVEGYSAYLLGRYDSFSTNTVSYCKVHRVWNRGTLTTNDSVLKNISHYYHTTRSGDDCYYGGNHDDPKNDVGDCTPYNSACVKAYYSGDGPYSLVNKGFDQTTGIQVNYQSFSSQGMGWSYPYNTLKVVCGLTAGTNISAPYGGSNYTGDLTDASAAAGVQSGNGHATVTYVGTTK
jgi:prepilin-type N-terminal cleavage/methylation domain-containing protein